MPTSITSLWKSKPVDQAIPSTRPIHFPLKRFKHQVAHLLRKGRETIYRENRPISPRLRSEVLQLKSEPDFPSSQKVFKERSILYLDQSGNFSHQPFPDLKSDQLICATYCHGTVKSLLEEKRITEREVADLKDQISDFDANLEHGIWKWVDVNTFETTALFLPFDSYKLPDFIASKNDDVFDELVDEDIPHIYRHLKKKDKTKSLGYTKVFVNSLKLHTDKDMQDFLASGWHMLKKSKGVIFNENRNGKITTHLLIHFDRVSPIKPISRTEPSDTWSIPVMFVFCKYNIIIE